MNRRRGLQVLIASLATPTGACLRPIRRATARPGPPPWAPAHGYRRRARYRHFPGKGVYFDIEAGIWHWAEGGQWRSGPNLPPGLSVEGEISEIVEFDEAEETERPGAGRGRGPDERPTGRGRGRPR